MSTKAVVTAALVVATVVTPASNALSGSPRFESRSQRLPIEHVYAGGWEHFVGGGIAVFDCNGDDLPEFFAAGGENRANLFLNMSEPGGLLRFEWDDRLPEMRSVTGAYPINIDGDAHDDLIVLRVGENIALRGLGDCRFERANELWRFDGGSAWSTSFSATWEEGQTWPTLFVGNYVDRADPDGPFEACDSNLLHRPEGASFAAPQTIEPGFCALSALISDELRLGRRDLRISNDRHYYVRGGSEQKIRLDTLEFLGPDEGWPTISLWGMGIAAQDITGDGRAEVMSTSMGDQLMQIATDNGFKNAPYAMGTYAQKPFFGDDGRPSTGWHAQFGDVNNDGLADLFIAKGNVDQMPSNAIKDPNNLLMQTADGSFLETAMQAGVATTDRSRGAALADLNKDGLLDLIVVNRRAPLELYENVAAGAGNWVMIDLQGMGGNVDAIGAFVEVRTTSGLQTREITIGGGHAGGQLLPQHFGLGSAANAQVKITATDGTAAIDWTALPVNARCRFAFKSAKLTCQQGKQP
ncbi:MAG: CRTAC1 family protein [Pseudomonadota bacterium]